MIAMGLDPGTICTGYAVLRGDGNRIIRLKSGTIRTASKAPLETRLLEIYDGLIRVIRENGPQEAAVENIFFAKNAMSALKLGHARGAILLALAQNGIEVTSYAPALIKRSIVGSGRAAKSQIGKVVRTILKMPHTPGEDEGDALAVAICHLNASRLVARQAKIGTSPKC